MNVNRLVDLEVQSFKIQESDKRDLNRLENQAYVSSTNLIDSQFAGEWDCGDYQIDLLMPLERETSYPYDQLCLMENEKREDLDSLNSLLSEALLDLDDCIIDLMTLKKNKITNDQLKSLRNVETPLWKYLGKTYNDSLTKEMLQLSTIEWPDIMNGDRNVLIESRWATDSFTSEYLCGFKKNIYEVSTKERYPSETMSRIVMRFSCESFVDSLKIYYVKYTNTYKKWRGLLTEELSCWFTSLSEKINPTLKVAFEYGVNYPFILTDDKKLFRVVCKTTDAQSCQDYLEKGDLKVMNSNETQLNIKQDDPQQRQMRVLRFLREFMRISAQDLADRMDEDGPSRSMIAQVERGRSYPTSDFLEHYAKALKDIVGIKRDLIDVAQKCAEDKELLNLMEQYEKKKGGFVNTFRISQKIIAISGEKKV